MLETWLEIRFAGMTLMYSTAEDSVLYDFRYLHMDDDGVALQV